MAKTRPIHRRTGGGYQVKETDYITVKECILLINHYVKEAIDAERAAAMAEVAAVGAAPIAMDDAKAGLGAETVPTDAEGSE